MESLKNNIDKISDETKGLFNDYIKMLSVQQSEKFALFLGILTTAFILTMSLMVIVILVSFAAAGFLNQVLDSYYLGTLIIIGIFLIFIGFLVFMVIKTRKPLLADLFAKIIVSVFNMDVDHKKNIQGLRYETELLKTRIGHNKTNIKTNFQLMRYSITEGLLKELFGLFKSGKKKDNTKKKE